MTSATLRQPAMKSTILSSSSTQSTYRHSQPQSVMTPNRTAQSCSYETTNTDKQSQTKGEDCIKINSSTIAFRGSHNIDNWLSDLDSAQSQLSDYDWKCRGCMIHHGFKNAYQSFHQADINTRVRKIVNGYRTKQLIFTGHSLGGALANIAALKYAEAYPSENLVIQVYTMGQPRVGNRQYASYHDGLIEHNFRLVHDEDCVPHMPDRLIGYLHSGSQQAYQQQMASKIGCKGKSLDCSNRKFRNPLKLAISLIKTKPFQDHRMKNYRALKWQTEL